MRRFLTCLYCLISALTGVSPALATTVNGTVSDAGTGAPIAGAALSLVYLGLPPTLGGSATTNASGFYSFEAIGSGNGSLTASAPGYLAQQHNVEAPGGPGVVTANFQLGQPARISGRVIAAESGLPLSSKSISLISQQGNTGSSTSSSATGEFELLNIQPGFYGVCVFDRDDDFLDECFDNYEARPGEPLQNFTLIEITSNSHITGIEIRLDRGASITGTLTDRATGLPIANNQVIATLFSATGQSLVESISVTTDETGNYEISGLFDGSYYLAFSGQEPYYTQSVYPGVDCVPILCTPLAGSSVVVGAPGSVLQGVNMSLFPGSTISGRVTDRATGQAIAGLPIVLYRQIFVPWIEAKRTVTDVDGNYMFRHEQSGQRLVTTDTNSQFINQRYPGTNCLTDCTAALGGFELTANQVLSGIDFALDKGVGIYGRARIPGYGFDNYQVRVHDQQGNFLQTVQVGADGQYRSRAWLAGTQFANSSSASNPVFCEIYSGFHCNGQPITNGTPILLPNSGDSAQVDFNVFVEGIFQSSFD